MAEPTALTAAQPQTSNTYFDAREHEKGAAKQAVGEYVVDHLLHEGDSILLDAGTSSYPIAEQIARKAQKEPAKAHFTIMTHNYKAFDILVQKVPRDAMVNIVLAGGRYDQDLNALFGPQTLMSYNNFFPRVTIVAVSSMVADKGLFCHGNTEELAVKEAIFKKSARDRIIVADHTKLGVPDALCFGESHLLRANVERCVLVTDTPSSEDKETRERFEREVERLRSIYRIEVQEVKVKSETN